MAPMPELRCIAGAGVEGDRYNTEIAKGRYSISPEPGRQLTLISTEGMDRVCRESGLDIGPHNSRRNLVTNGIHLRDLVGYQLRIGKEVVVFVHRWTVPCMYLEGLLGQKGFFEAIYYDAGLCCEILVGGSIRPDDAIEVVAGSLDLARCKTWAKAKLVRPSERTPQQKEEMLEGRRQLEEQAKSDPMAKKRLRNFDQAFGRKDASWDGGKSQW